MVHFAVCFDMNGYHSIHIRITDYLMEALKNFETNQMFRSVKAKKSATISHGVYYFLRQKLSWLEHRTGIARTRVQIPMES